MSDSGPKCPVCKDRDQSDALASQNVLLMGMQAILDRDNQAIKDVYSTLTAWDAHCAITMMLGFIGDICMMLGEDVRESVADMRRQVQNAQAQQQP